MMTKTKTRMKKRKTRKIQSNYLKNYLFKDIAGSLHKLGAFFKKQVLTITQDMVILSIIRRPQRSELDQDLIRLRRKIARF